MSTAPDPRGSNLIEIAEMARGSIYEAFAAAALRHAGRVAIAGASTLTYRNLADASAAIHALLASAGTRPRDGVGLFFDRPSRQIAAILGVLRAGAYYVCLDPEFPEARLKQILADGVVSTLLVEREHLTLAQSLVPSDVRVVVCPEDFDPGKVPPPAAVESQDLAYVAYTSGSTGKPKGVMHQHANVLHEAAVHRLTLNLQPDDRFTLLYSLGVTGSVRDVFPTLLSGARLCPFPFKQRGFAELKKWLIAERITQFHSVPSIFRELMRVMEPGERLDSVRTVFVAGERVSPEDYRQFRQHFPETARFYTGIGATETSSIYTHWFVGDETSRQDGRLPTGWPLPHKEVLLVGDDRQPLPAGEPGEIAVCSHYLSKGYWNQPTLTATAFTDANDGSGRRIYHTGDFGYFDADGRLIHLGRRDRQVKINGQRVELGEIEAVLLEQPGVAAVATRVFEENGSARPRIAAYVVAPGVDVDVLRTRLAQKLPSAAVPAFIVPIERLPLTSNGKLDYQALPSPNFGKSANGVNSQEDWTHEERRVLEVWREAFPGLPGYRKHDTFDDLGGDSLQALCLAELLNQKLHIAASIGEFLPSESIATLAQRLAAVSHSAPADPTQDKVDRMVSLARTWKLPSLALPVTDGCPVYLAGANRPGMPLVWFGYKGVGLEIGLALSKYRPVYLIPTVPAASTAEMESDCRWLADLVLPHLPEGVMCGGYCYSGVRAMVLAHELKARGKKVESLFLIEAFGSRRSRALFAQVVRAQRHMRQLRAWSLTQSFRHYVRRVNLKAQQWIGSEPSAIEYPFPTDFEPFGYDGEIVHILSSSTAWMRWILPRLGWGAVENSRAQFHTARGDHFSLCQEPERVETILKELAEQVDARQAVACTRGPEAVPGATSPLDNISDTARWVAVYRGWESRRPDAVFSDPFAEKLAGEQGERIVRKLGANWMESSIVVRTVAIDDFVSEAAREGIDTVLNLAAGLDTRPYRMDLPATMHWIEVDLPEILAYKEARLVGETPRCRLTRIASDLADDATRRDLFDRIAAQASNVLVITEGLLVYLPESAVPTLATDLAAHQNFVYWAQDFVSPEMLASLNKSWGATLGEAKARMMFAPPAGAEYFLRFGWKPRTVRYFSDEARRLNRETHSPQVARNRNGNGYALLERTLSPS